MKTQQKRTMDGPFEVHVINEPDTDHEPPEVNPDNYKGESADDIAEYIAQDQARLDAYNHGEWCYLTLGVELRIDTAQHCRAWTTVGRAYLSGVESDAEPSFIAECLEDLKAEARLDAKRTHLALCVAFETEASE